jgi:hypothetical protein
MKAFLYLGLASLGLSVMLAGCHEVGAAKTSIQTPGVSVTTVYTDGNLNRVLKIRDNGRVYTVYQNVRYDHQSSVLLDARDE